MNREQEINAQIAVGELQPKALKHPEEVVQKLNLFSTNQLLDMIEVIIMFFEKSSLPVNDIRIKEKVSILLQTGIRLGNLEKHPAPPPEQPYNPNYTPEDHASVIEHCKEVASRMESK